jgi:hypothetical protein
MGSYQLERLNGIEKYLHDAGIGEHAVSFFVDNIQQ